MKLQISASELKEIFISSFSKERAFKFENGNPFMIYLNSKHYYIFLKKMSSAYYPNYPDITRIQLPYSPHFKKIYDSTIPFVILGYNSEFKTFTAWDPRLIKKRLNAKPNVSLFCRASFQEQLRKNVFREYTISNGDKVIVFSYKSLPRFFKNFASFFENPLSPFKKTINKQQYDDRQPQSSSNNIDRISNTSVLRKIHKFRNNNDLIGAVIFCSNFFKDMYPGTSLKKWTKIISKIFREDETLLLK